MTIPQAFDLAIQHHQAGRLGDAEALYRQILAMEPKQSDALHLLGVIAHQTGRHDAAIEYIRQAIILNPNHSAAHSNLGEACRAMGRLDEAVASYLRALELQPDYPEALNNLGNALREQGQPHEAIVAYRRALALKLGYPEAHNNLGNSLRDQGQLEEAITEYRRALAFKPNYPEAHNNLGVAFASQRRHDEAITAYRRALALKPNYPEALNNLGNALKDQAELDEAIACFRHALQIKPDDARTHSNLIYTLHFHPDYGDEAIAHEHERWNRQFANPLKRFMRSHANERNPERRLRIGYVSPDLRDHVVGRNLVPLFRCHDRENFEIFCYSGVVRPDGFTNEFQKHAHHWRGTVGVDDESLAQTIRQDGVDILVDLSQHLGGNRLPLFARKPAPVQVSFAGYPDSSGLETIEYRLTDQHLEAGRTGNGFLRKEHVCLIDSFWCYDPCGVELEPNALPATESGRITFGCMNNFCKINGRVLTLWARVLRKVKNSRLLILSRHGSPRQRTLEILEGEGVNRRRVEFVEHVQRKEYLELYHRFDIVLDTAPYNGHTTSLDALWMGVPVISLAGDVPVSRAGLSHWTNLDLPELVAHSEEDYVGIAAKLAGDLPRLAELRTTLRSRMQASPLTDAPRFARNIEAAYRFMWRRWCATP